MGRFKELTHMSSWRRIASAMWAEHNSPQILGFDDIDMSEINRLIPILRERSGGVKVTPTHFAVKAIGEILGRIPDFNVVMVRGKIMQRPSVDIFVQVAIKADNASKADLSGIKIKNVDQKSVTDIAREIAERANKVRTGQDKDLEQTKRLMDRMPSGMLGQVMRTLSNLTFDREMDLSSYGVKTDPFGSAMVSNVAPFNIQAGFAPLIPISRTPYIFLLGRTDQKPVVRDGEIVIRPIARQTATFDHRMLDGFQIGKVCDLFRVYQEDPEGSGIDLY